MNTLVQTIPHTLAPVAWVMQSYTPGKRTAPSVGTFFRPQNVQVFVKAPRMVSFLDNKAV